MCCGWSITQRKYKKDTNVLRWEKNQNNWQRRNTTLTRELPVHWIQCEKKTRELQELQLIRFGPNILPTIPGHRISLGAGSNKLHISKDCENTRTKIWGFLSSHQHCDQWCKSAHGSCSTALTGQCCNTNSMRPDNSHCCKTAHPEEDSPKSGRTKESWAFSHSQWHFTEDRRCSRELQLSCR